MTPPLRPGPRELMDGAGAGAVGALVLIVAALLSSGVCASAQAPTALTRLLDAELGRMPATAGAYVKHLATGEEAVVRADDAFNSYSVIKLPLMVMAYELADRGQLSMSERHTMAASDFRGGSGILRHHDVGWSPTLHDLVIEMIITSDNTATDLVLAKVGGLDAFNRWLVAKGFGRTRMVMTLFDFFRKPYELKDPKYRSVSPEELLKMQTGGVPLVETREERIARDRDPANWLGSMTPRETGRLLEGIERGTLVSKTASTDMTRILRAQQAGARRMPHFLPPGYATAHKTGDGPPIIANDVGIVYARSGPIVMAFFTAENRGLFQDLEDQIGRTTRLVVDYFDGRVHVPQ